MKSGDVVIATLQGAVETKVPPGIVIASDTYLREHRDVIVRILTSKIPSHMTGSDYVLQDWQEAGLRAKSCFRAYILTLLAEDATSIGRLSPRDWTEVRHCVRTAFTSL